MSPVENVTVPERQRPRTPCQTLPQSPAEGRIAELARSRLRGSGYPALEGVNCNYREGSLIVSGDVPSFYMKQVVYVLLKDLDGPARIVDRMTVGSPT